MNLNVPKEIYAAIEKEIFSDKSPVGIDAKKTHIIILHKLIEIEKRITALENETK